MHAGGTCAQRNILGICESDDVIRSKKESVEVGHMGTNDGLADYSEIRGEEWWH